MSLCPVNSLVKLKRRWGEARGRPHFLLSHICIISVVPAVVIAFEFVKRIFSKINK